MLYRYSAPMSLPAVGGICETSLFISPPALSYVPELAIPFRGDISTRKHGTSNQVPPHLMRIGRCLRLCSASDQQVR